MTIESMLSQNVDAATSQCAICYHRLLPMLTVWLLTGGYGGACGWIWG